MTTEVAADVPPSAEAETMRSDSAAPSAAAAAAEATTKSALQDNIDRRGGNAYYYAHSHRATGPVWDGKAEPKLLSKHAVQQGHKILSSSSSSSTFDYAASNITTYAFLDDGPKVKLYVDLEGIGERCRDDDVTLDYAETSLCLKIANYIPPGVVAPVAVPATTAATSGDNASRIETPQAPPVRCLCFSRLSGSISSASFKLKASRIMLTLVKSNPDEVWHTINDKGAPDHEVE
jgi:hypothetical protein